MASMVRQRAQLPGPEWTLGAAHDASAGWLYGFEAGSSGQYPPLACAGAQAKPFLSMYDVGIGTVALVVVLPPLAQAVIPMVVAAIPASMQAINFFI
jgi:hypothetical protein